MAGQSLLDSVTPSPVGIGMPNGIGTHKVYNFSGVSEWAEESGPGKTVYTFASEKGAGKTTLALGFQYTHDGEFLAFSYDGKTQKIRYKDYPDNTKIHVFDITKVYSRNLEEKLESGAKCVDLIMGKLASVPDDYYDWILHDYVDLLPVLTEMKARKKHGKGVSQPCGGYDQMWKDRKAFIQDIHRVSVSKAKYGVIYTGFTVRDNIVVDGETITTGPRKPKWNDIVEAETDVVIILGVEHIQSKEGNEVHRYAFIDSCKETDAVTHREYPRTHTWYKMDNKEDLKLFVTGKGIEVNREPPKPLDLSKIPVPVVDEKEDMSKKRDLLV